MEIIECYLKKKSISVGYYSVIYWSLRFHLTVNNSFIVGICLEFPAGTYDKFIFSKLCIWYSTNPLIVTYSYMRFRCIRFHIMSLKILYWNSESYPIPKVDLKNIIYNPHSLQGSDRVDPGLQEDLCLLNVVNIMSEGGRWRWGKADLLHMIKWGGIWSWGNEARRRKTGTPEVGPWVGDGWRKIPLVGRSELWR